MNKILTILYRIRPFETMTKINIHNSKKRIEYAKAIIQKRFPEENAKTALTEYGKRLGNVAKIYGNWSRGSNMLAVYVHPANSDQEDAVLRLLLALSNVAVLCYTAIMIRIRF